MRSTTTIDQRFTRTFRIRKQSDFDRVYRSNAHAADAVLVVIAGTNGLPHPRLGLAVSRRVGNAVVRNRWKRLIREAFRRLRGELPAGYDFVVRPRRGAVADAAAIGDSLRRLTRKAVRRLEGK